MMNYENKNNKKSCICDRKMSEITCENEFIAIPLGYLFQMFQKTISNE